MSLKKSGMRPANSHRKRGNTAHSKRCRERRSAPNAAKHLECGAFRRFSVRWQADLWRIRTTDRLLTSAATMEFGLWSLEPGLYT